MRLFVAVLLSSGALLGQTTIPGNRLGMNPDLKAFLGLSDDQAERIRKNNEDLVANTNARQERSFLLSREIAQELAKPSPDPMAVGSRHAELEAGCREVSRLGSRTREQNLALLNDAQKAKLKLLEEASRMQSVIQEANAANIYRATAEITAAPFPLGWLGFGGGTALAIPGLSNVRSSCGFSPFASFLLGRPVLP